MSVSKVTRPRSRSHRVRALGPMLICAVVLVALLASSARSQVLDGQILLPDSLGPLPGKTHVAFDEDPDHPRMFIGSDSGDVLVVNSLTGERVARMETGPVKSICYCPAHNKLYISLVNAYSVVVLDCNTYQTITELQIGTLVTGLLYNPIVDRVYCATWHVQVIDCASDRVVDSLMVYCRKCHLALDSLHNKLYVGSTDTFRVVDCDADSIVANIPELQGAQAVCYVPSIPDNKVYVAAGESLFAVRVKTDTVVYRQRFVDTLYAQLACDPVHDRVYYSYWGHLIALDCVTDSIIWNDEAWARIIGLTASPVEDKVYALLSGLDVTFAYSLEGSTGRDLQGFYYTGYGSIPYSVGLDRVFLIPDGAAQVRAIDCRADTIATITPLKPDIGYLPNSACVDTSDNKLYFSAWVSGIGVVDCRTNKVKSYVYPSRKRYEFQPQALAYDSHDEKLDHSSDSSIFVLDCKTDTLVKEMFIGGRSVRLAWHPGLNKLYAYSYIQHVPGLVAIDCARDTVIQVLSLPDSTGDIAFLSPELTSSGSMVSMSSTASVTASCWIPACDSTAAPPPTTLRIAASTQPPIPPCTS